MGDRRSFAPRKRQKNYKRNNFRQNNARQKKYIDPHKFINKATATSDEPKKVSKLTFNDFDLCDKSKRNLNQTGFIHPSEIQERCIPLILDGEDVLGLANTGTGKTAAFILPIIEHLLKAKTPLSVLILAPTRELAQQTNDEFKRFASGMQLWSTVCVGGVNIQRQIRDLKRKPHVVIATPGRLNDLIDRKLLSLNKISMFVLDEADRMLDMGFSKDIEKIGKVLPKERQTLCFSATMDSKAKLLIDKYLKKDYKTISAIISQTNDHIDQDIIKFTDKSQKIELLEALLEQSDYDKVLIFSETKRATQKLADHLTKNHLPSVSIHGNKSQSQRQRALKQFKSRDTCIMVATDVAARGLDIDDIACVINYEQPQTYADYVHRIGRTGRGGKAGKALTFVDERSIR